MQSFFFSYAIEKGLFQGPFFFGALILLRFGTVDKLAVDDIRNEHAVVRMLDDSGYFSSVFTVLR